MTEEPDNSISDIAFADGGELAHLEDLYGRTQKDVVNELIESETCFSSQAEMQPFKGGKGIDAERLIAVRRALYSAAPFDESAAVDMPLELLSRHPVRFKFRELLDFKYQTLLKSGDTPSEAAAEAVRFLHAELGKTSSYWFKSWELEQAETQIVDL